MEIRRPFIELAARNVEFLLVFFRYTVTSQPTKACYYRHYIPTLAQNFQDYPQNGHFLRSQSDIWFCYGRLIINIFHIKLENSILELPMHFEKWEALG